MADVYVYYFIGSVGLPGENGLSTRPATLEAIKGRGEPVMESQMVVDHTELDGDGFLVASVGDGSYALNDITARILSLELRAASRDAEAMKLNESTEGQSKYMLSLESRELRRQARQLEDRRIQLMAGELSHHADTADFIQFGGELTTE
jgi:hypothetical protein